MSDMNDAQAQFARQIQGRIEEGLARNESRRPGAVVWCDNLRTVP